MGWGNGRTVFPAPIGFLYQLGENRDRTTILADHRQNSCHLLSYGTFGEGIWSQYDRALRCLQRRVLLRDQGIDPSQIYSKGRIVWLVFAALLRCVANLLSSNFCRSRIASNALRLSKPRLVNSVILLVGLDLSEYRIVISFKSPLNDLDLSGIPIRTLPAYL